MNGMDEWQEKENAKLAGPPDPDSLAAMRSEIDRLRKALRLLTEEYHTLDEPDEDWEVIVKMRAIAREALETESASEQRR